MREDVRRLQDVLEAIARIDKYAIQGREVFQTNELIQVWILHHLWIIGEAMRHVSDAVRNQHPEVPWSDIIAMRNILIHKYFGVNLQEVWHSVEHDVPILKNQVEVILRYL